MQYGDINKQGSYGNELEHLREPQDAYQQAASVILKQVPFVLAFSSDSSFFFIFFFFFFFSVYC